MVMLPQIWGLLSVALVCVALIPYLLATIKGTNRPHIFTWVIWTLLASIAFLLQYTEGAGSGAWSGFVSILLSIAILSVAIRNGKKQITRSDWVVFIAALAAIPIWLLTKNPLLAVIWVTGIAGAGFIPTFRKSWFKPYEEMVATYAVSVFRHFFSLLAVEVVGPTTTIYPIGMLVMNSLLVMFILFRRWMLKRTS